MFTFYHPLDKSIIENESVKTSVLIYIDWAKSKVLHLIVNFFCECILTNVVQLFVQHPKQWLQCSSSHYWGSTDTVTVTDFSTFLHQDYISPGNKVTQQQWWVNYSHVSAGGSPCLEAHRSVKLGTVSLV